ncbi:MAG: hypothetical protein QOG82_980 [Actinomycetota bacterium]|nr:hypothetical protein [Actinomycetota bacterium]
MARSDGMLRLRDSSLEWRLVEGEVVVLDIDRAEFLAVNRSGAAIWSLLVEGASHNRLVAVMVERYDLDPTQAAADVGDFVAALTERGLLED